MPKNTKTVQELLDFMDETIGDYFESCGTDYPWGDADCSINGNTNFAHNVVEVCRYLEPKLTKKYTDTWNKGKTVK